MFYAEINEIVIKTVQRRQRIRTIWKQRTKKNSLVQKQEADLGDNNVGLRAYSRCSVPYFFEVIKGIRSCPHKTKLVIEMGFEELLQLDDSHVPRVFAQRIADKCSFRSDDVIVIHESIVMNADSVKDTFAIPSGSSQVDGDEDEGKLAFLPTTMPRIRVRKGDLITHFSNMVLARTGPAHPLKDISNTCYASSTFEDCNLKDAIKLAVGYSLSDKMKFVIVFKDTC